MIKLELKNWVLVVQGSEETAITHGELRIFFTALSEHQLDEANNRYLYTEKTKLLEVIKETVQYLEEEGIKYTTDEQVSGILKRFNQEKIEYENVIDRIRKKSISEKLPPTYEGQNFIRTLRPHQQGGLNHLLSVNHGANFSVPGSGKTAVIYAAFDYMRKDNTIDKIFVIGPRSCFLPWEEEAGYCFEKPIRIMRLAGPKTQRNSAYYLSEEYDLFLCTYQTVVNDIEDIIALCQRHKVLLVIDESHNIKKLEGGVWSEAMLRIAPYAIRRALLSGTPMPNDYSDLWTQITFLWPGEHILGNRSQFRYRCEDEKERAEIKKSLRNIIYRTKKSELGLPPVKFILHKCDLQPYQSSIYKALAVKYLSELQIQPEDRESLRLWRKGRLVRLIQAASNPTLLNQFSEEFNIDPLAIDRTSILQLIEKYPNYEIPVKFELANKLIRELLANGEKVVLWTTFVHNIKMLRKILKDIKPFIVFGAVPRDESESVEFNREQQIRHFKETNIPSVLIANPAACAESISLHKTCHHALYLDRTFNCGQYMQSLDRLHRIGLNEDEIVYYHILLANKTIDETIEKRLLEKQKIMLSLLEDELPIGTLEVEEYQMEPKEDQEMIDFNETIIDLKKYWS